MGLYPFIEEHNLLFWKLRPLLIAGASGAVDICIHRPIFEGENFFFFRRRGRDDAHLEQDNWRRESCFVGLHKKRRNVCMQMPPPPPQINNRKMPFKLSRPKETLITGSDKLQGAFVRPKRGPLPLLMLALKTEC